MDKLEKALEKSRQQRALIEAEHGKVEPTVGSPAPTFDVPNVDEAFMEKNRIVAHKQRCAEADVYRQLRTKVLQVMNAKGYKALAITSPNYKDGKTTVSINLGISIAQDLKQSVLIVDLDFRKPSLDQYLGLKSEYGLTDYLRSDRPLKDCIVRPPFERVSVLPAGSSLDNSSELLSSPKMISLAREVKTRYPDRLVIYDLPPVLIQDDPVAFLPQIDAVLVVVRDGVTKPEDLKRCLDSLSSANVIGTVLNNCW